LLLQRVRDPQYLPPPHTLDVDADVAKDLDRLNALRNEFIHFVPKGLSLGVGGMPRIVGRCCDVIERLAGKNRSFRLTTAQRRRCAAALADVRRGVAAWATAQK
jgi:hypothetical protein